MKFLFALFMQFLFLTAAFGYCDQLYIDEINKLSEGLKTKSNSPAGSQDMKRRDSLELVKNVLTEISQNNLNGAATQKFQEKIQVNPRTIQNALKRANKYNRLCEKGILLDVEEIGKQIRDGKMP